MADNKPVEKFRAGAITATIWSKDMTTNGKTYPVFNVAIERNYLDKDKKWQKTSNYNANDLPKVVLVAQQAYEYLVTKHEKADE